MGSLRSSNGLECGLLPMTAGDAQFYRTVNPVNPYARQAHREKYFTWGQFSRSYDGRLPNRSPAACLNDEQSCNSMNSTLSILKEFWHFLKIRKKRWLVPIVFFLLMLGVLQVAAKGSALAPFIYSLF